MEPAFQHNGSPQTEGEGLKINISPEEINTLPLKTFEGKTVVISDAVSE